MFSGCDAVFKSLPFFSFRCRPGRLTLGVTYGRGQLWFVASLESPAGEQQRLTHAFPAPGRLAAPLRPNFPACHASCGCTSRATLGSSETQCTLCELQARFIHGADALWIKAEKNRANPSCELRLL